MSTLLGRIFGKNEDLKAIYKRGAIVVDVRGPEEFRSGHIEGAINIPLNLLEKHIADLKSKNRPILTCCRSGARSGMARAALSAAGIEVYNGGPWDALKEKIQ